MGQLLRIIIILIGLWLVLTIIKRALSSHRNPPDKPAVAKMVACAHCGVHIPESEAVRDGDRHYCSEEHRKKTHA